MISDENAPERQKLLADLIAVIREEIRLAIAWNDTAAAFAGLYPTDATILFFLKEYGSATAAQVGAAAGLTTGATTAALNRLEQGGFIARKPDKRDGRRVIVHAIQLPSQFRTIQRQTEAELRIALESESNADIQSLITHRRQTNAMLVRITEKLTKPPSQLGTENANISKEQL